VVGKHSGSRTIYRKFQEFGIELSDHDASEILKMVRQTAIELKRALFSKEIMYIYQDYIARLGDELPVSGYQASAAPARQD
jgi:homocitrate synthase NifV